jgi:hypothetical protein
MRIARRAAFGCLLLSLGVMGWSATITVTTVADTGAGSLREAIGQANSNGGPDTIQFAAGLAGKTVRPQSSLPAITDDATTIDGDIDHNGVPDIILNGSMAGGAGLRLCSRDNTIRGLNIRHWERGIWVFGATATGNRVAGNRIGTNLGGRYSLGNDVGVYISGSASNNTIGGKTAADRNLISGNRVAGIGLRAANNNLIIGNRIGTDVTGKRWLGNSVGIAAYYCEGTRIGDGTTTGRNLISGQAPQEGMYAAQGALADGAAQGIYLDAGGIYLYQGANHRVRGNFIGTDVTGKQAVSNVWCAITCWATVGTTLGGSAPGDRNVMSGNDYGVRFFFCSDVTIINNRIGTDATGSFGIPNHDDGLDIGFCRNVTVGGLKATLRNVIGANTNNGIDIGDSEHVQVIGNYIGVSASGVAAIGNESNGVYVSSSRYTYIGSTAPKSGNVISGNGDDGIELTYDADSTQVVRNTIGWNPGRSKPLPNAGMGVRLSYEAHGSAIGGNSPALGNQILAAEGKSGVYISGSGIYGTSITNNTILGPSALGKYGVCLDFLYATTGGFGGNISRNVIRRFEDGIYLNAEGAKPNVTRNVISHCTNLVYIDKDALPLLGDLEDSRAWNNGGNVFRNASSFAVYNKSANNIKAEGNDWGATDAATIDGLIYDGNDGAGLGLVDYDPLMGGVHPSSLHAAAACLASVAALPTHGGAEVVFSLSAPADVSVEILNMAGRAVALIPAHAAKAGVNRLSWNGFSAQGTRAPAGTYLVRVRARDRSGAQSSALSSLSLVR